ncbi:hypothetical protein D6C77_04061 [Aureobasidium pullulans]|nr:hypothetical protein D6C77_04061 [Aureobasidium pullulans]
MCSKRVSPYHECPYSHKEVTDEKFCFRDGVIVPCVNWEWLIIKELPTPGPCPCADCQAWKRRQNMQNGTVGSRSNDISHCRDVNKNANLGTIDTNMAQKGRRSLKHHKRNGGLEERS